MSNLRRNTIEYLETLVVVESDVVDNTSAPYVVSEPDAEKYREDWFKEWPLYTPMFY